MGDDQGGHGTVSRHIAGSLAAVLLVVTSAACSGGWPTVAGAAAGAAASSRPAGVGTGSLAGSQLGPGQVLAPGQAGTSPDGQIVLTMQFDGNLVAYATVDGTARVLWASGTQGNPGAQSVMQDDGNLVVYSSTGSALWSAGTAGNPGAVTTVQDDGNVVVYGSGGNPLWSTGSALDFVGPDDGPTLAAGQSLRPGEFLQSANGQYRLYETPEGPPALYQQGTDGLWWLMEGSDSLVSVPGIPTFISCALCTGSASVLAGSFLTLQGDGNLVLYPPGGGPAEWSAGTAGSGGVSLQLQDDGNLVLYAAPSPVGPATAVWQTGTDAFRGTVLGEGVTLQAGQFVLSPDGALELVMQADGNLVVYGAGVTGALWASGTNGDQGAFCSLQDDDNLVVYGQPAAAVERPDVTGTSGQSGPEVADWASGAAASKSGSGLAYAEIGAVRPSAGAGSGVLSSASPAWNGLAAELARSAAQYESIVQQLSQTPYGGPRSAQTAAAVTPYVSWLSATATQAQQAAQQAQAATAAFEAAFATTVPPPVVAANRAQLASLVATNVLGQNTPAIAATEAQYAEMWAQDAAAMYGYAAASRTAVGLPLAELNGIS